MVIQWKSIKMAILDRMLLLRKELGWIGFSLGRQGCSSGFHSSYGPREMLRSSPDSPRETLSTLLLFLRIYHSLWKIYYQYNLYNLIITCCYDVLATTQTLDKNRFGPQLNLTHCSLRITNNSKYLITSIFFLYA